ncbi:hypothetical protein [Nonomuraea dietziae]|uniref:hypothetical protein n=1 Tax=Nonomuraea dietziae TaxID=65515 RepID=UPI00341E2F12
MRKVSVASSLAAEGAPVVPPTDLMPPDRVSHAGLHVPSGSSYDRRPDPAFVEEGGSW